MHFHNTMDQRCVLVSCPDLGTAGQPFAAVESSVTWRGRKWVRTCVPLPWEGGSQKRHLHGEEGATDWLFKA